MTFYSTKENQFFIAFKVKPNKKETKVIDIEDKYLILDLQGPPVDGQANEELIRFVSKQIKCAKREIEFVSGEKWKTKVIAIPKTETSVQWIQSLEEKFPRDPQDQTLFSV